MLTEFKESCYGGRSWASVLARRGYLVLVIDGFFFGSRRLDYDGLSDEIKTFLGNPLMNIQSSSDAYIPAFNEACSGFEAMLLKYICMAGCTWPGILFHDDRKCVDYLLSRNDGRCSETYTECV